MTYKQQSQYKMLLKRKYFKSFPEDFSFSKVPQSSYLYIYKHHCPQIIVRFPKPKQTITGYDMTQAQILYYPFYEDLGVDFEAEIHQKPQKFINGPGSQKMNIEKITFPYNGELILNKEAEIFVQFLKKQLDSLIQQTRNPPPIKKHTKYTSPPKIQIQISQVFQILCNQWFNDPFINAIFLITEKHLETFSSFDHGFLRLQVLKTSQTNMQIPFYKSPTAKLRKVKLIENKHYFFQFESSIIYQEKDYSYVEKVGIIMPRPLSVNEFFYEVLIHMFNEFEEEQEKKKNQKKRQEERRRIKETLLQNLIKMGVQANLPDFPVPGQENDQPQLEGSDPLDTMLNQIFAKKKKPKQEKENTSTSQLQSSSLKERRSSQFERSPEKKEQNQEELGSEEVKKKSKPKNQIKVEQANVKVMSSFTSEILDDEFQQKTKRRFVTKSQFDKLHKLHQKIITKKQQKQLIARQQKYLAQGKDTEAKLDKKLDLVYIGIQKSKPVKPKNTQNDLYSNRNYAFDYFSIHQDTIILQKQQQIGFQGARWGEDHFIEKRTFGKESRNEEIDPIVIPGLEEISIIEKRGKDKERERNSKIKAIQLIYDGIDNSMDHGQYENYAPQQEFNIDDYSEYE